MQLSQNFTTSIALFYIYSRCVMISTAAFLLSTATSLLSTAASLLSTAASFRRSSTWWGWHQPLPPTSGRCPQTWTWWQWWHCSTAWPPGTRPSVRCKGIGRASGTRGCLRQLAWSCGCPRALPSSSWGHSSQKIVTLEQCLERWHNHWPSLSPCINFLMIRLVLMLNSFLETKCQSQ